MMSRVVGAEKLVLLLTIADVLAAPREDLFTRFDVPTSFFLAGPRADRPVSNPERFWPPAFLERISCFRQLVKLPKRRRFDPQGLWHVLSLFLSRFRYVQSLRFRPRNLFQVTEPPSCPRSCTKNSPSISRGFIFRMCS